MLHKAVAKLGFSRRQNEIVNRNTNWINCRFPGPGFAQLDVETQLEKKQQTESCVKSQIVNQEASSRTMAKVAEGVRVLATSFLPSSLDDVRVHSLLPEDLK